MFDRQSRLEKIREGKNREQKTKINFKSTHNNDDSWKKSELLNTAAGEKDISELVEKMVSCCNFMFFNNQLRALRIYVLYG